MPITYGSVCSGIEAATAAWHPLGMTPAWFAEIEPFPSAVLAHHYPNVQNLGDMTKLAALVLAGKIKAPAVLVGGTPCQAFSVAGMREGLADPRGALTIKYVELADAIDHVRARRGDPEVITVWENVPGVLSDKGNAFGCFLGALAGENCELKPSGKRWTDAGCVYGPKRAIAWRILDAQYFGLAQRRRRVFVVASSREGFDPASVLFEREGLRRDTAPRRKAREIVTGTISARSSAGGGLGTDFDLAGGIQVFGGNNTSGPIDVSPARNACASASGRMDFETEAFVVAPTLTKNHYADNDGREAALVVHGTQDPGTSQHLAFALGRNQGQENAVLAFTCKDYGADAGAIAPTLRAMGHNSSHPNAGGQLAVCVNGDITHTLKAEGSDGSEDGTGRGQPIVAFTQNSRSEVRHIGGDGQIVGALAAEAGAQQQNYLAKGSAVRRLTPTECERLQGFPDEYTLIPWRKKPASECPDGPRYKALGNSKAVPVVRWIGLRLLANI